MKDIIILGAGGHTRSLIDVIELEKKFNIVGLVDNSTDKVLGYDIIGNDNDLEKIRKNVKYAIVGVGQIKSPLIRIKLFNLLKKYDFILPTIISPLAYVSKYAFIDEGSVIMHNAFVNVNVKIGKNCIINTKSLIEHDVYIGDNTHISTASVVNGGVVIGNNSFIGSNSVLKEYITIEEDSIISAGSFVK